MAPPLGGALVSLTGKQKGQDLLPPLPLAGSNAGTHFFSFLFFSFFFFFLVSCLFRAAPAAYRGSEARGPIGAVAAGLHHSHSHSGSEPHLQPTPQLTTMLDP